MAEAMHPAPRFKLLRCLLIQEEAVDVGLMLAHNGTQHSEGQEPQEAVQEKAERGFKTLGNMALFLPSSFSPCVLILTIHTLGSPIQSWQETVNELKNSTCTHRDMNKIRNQKVGRGWSCHQVLAPAQCRIPN